MCLKYVSQIMICNSFGGDFVGRREQHKIVGYVVNRYITYSEIEWIKIILAGKIINKRALNWASWKSD